MRRSMLEVSKIRGRRHPSGVLAMGGYPLEEVQPTNPDPTDRLETKDERNRD